MNKAQTFSSVSSSPLSNHPIFCATLSNNLHVSSFIVPYYTVQKVKIHKVFLQGTHKEDCKTENLKTNRANGTYLFSLSRGDL